MCHRGRAAVTRCRCRYRAAAGPSLSRKHPGKHFPGCVCCSLGDTRLRGATASPASSSPTGELPPQSTEHRAPHTPGLSPCADPCADRFKGQPTAHIARPDHDDGTASQQPADHTFPAQRSGSWLSLPCNCRSAEGKQLSKAQVAPNAPARRVTALPALVSPSPREPSAAPGMRPVRFGPGATALNSSRPRAAISVCHKTSPHFTKLICTEVYQSASFPFLQKERRSSSDKTHGVSKVLLFTEDFAEALDEFAALPHPSQLLSVSPAGFEQLQAHGHKPFPKPQPHTHGTAEGPSAPHPTAKIGTELPTGPSVPTG